MSADWIVSANDAKLLRAAGTDAYPEHVGSDTLSLIDASRWPPEVVRTVDVATSIAGPPQAVALAPNGLLAAVAAPTRYDRSLRQLVFETFVQIVDFAAEPPLVRKIELGSHPQGLAINRAGTLLLAATTGGTLAVLGIEGRTVSLLQQIKLSKGRLAGVCFTPDGSAAMVALRDEQGLAVLEMQGLQVRLAPGRVSTGVAPYAIDVEAAGRWAVVGNVGLAGLAAREGVLVADADSFTLIDLSTRPFRAVQHVTVPSIPEGVAISPDGRWIATLSMDGSNLPPGAPGHRAGGRLQLFEIRESQAQRVADLPAGASAQGVVFSADSRLVFAQFFVDRQIAVYAVNGGALQDTGVRLEVTGGPSSLRGMPR
jgi:DNA-binding beta-propeller fold protein YncE